MNRNYVICGIEHALRDDGCNEIPVTMLFSRVKKTRGNFELTMEQFIGILKELEQDGLFEFYGQDNGLPQDFLVARSQMHPSVPLGDVIQT